jgi:predicted transcriptional regulator
MSKGRSKTMSDEEIVEAIRNHPDRAVTAREISDVVGMTSSGILKRLDKLAERGEVTRKKVGGRAVVWWAKDYSAESFARDAPSSESQ